MQGLKEGQILRTISNVTYSDSHYTSDEEKLGEVSASADSPAYPLFESGIRAPEHPLTPEGCPVYAADMFERPLLGAGHVHAKLSDPYVRGVILGSLSRIVIPAGSEAQRLSGPPHGSS